MSRPDEPALNDPAMELVLPEGGELVDLPASLVAPGKLPALWPDGEIAVQAVNDYFVGSKVVQVDRGGYQEPLHIPKAGQSIVEKAISASVEDGSVWLLSGPASILGEPIPTGILNASAKLCIPPAPVAAAEILPENLAAAWKDKTASGLSIATCLSAKLGKNLPWKTVKDVIASALQARFIEILPESQPWPCDLASAQFVKFKVAAGTGTGVGPGEPGGGTRGETKVLAASAELEPAQVQELGDIMPKLLTIKTKMNVPIKFHVRIELGDGKNLPPAEATKQANTLLKNVKEGLELR